MGWFLVTAGDGPHRITLEVRDDHPGLPGSEWTQIMETPYRSIAGTVGLATAVDGPALTTVDLLGPGSHRLQVCSRWEDFQGRWLLRWWPTPLEEPPRWLRRHPSPS